MGENCNLFFSNFQHDCNSSRFRFQCCVCKFQLNGDQNSINDHYERHKKSDPKKCVICEKMCASVCARNAHVLIHVKLFLYCYRNKLKYKYSNSIAFLQRDQKIYQCEICGCSFNLPSSLFNHITSHDKTNRKFECDICKKTFFSKGKLGLHMNVHVSTLFQPIID